VPTTNDWTDDLPDAGRIKIGFTDLDGVLRTKYLSRNKVVAAAGAGLGFCNVAFQWDINDALYPEADLFDPGFSDATLRLDGNTLRRLPWEGGVPLVLGDFRNDPSPVRTFCPRAQLVQLIEKAAAMGLSARFGPEYEWFVYRGTPSELSAGGYQKASPVTPGMFGYSGLRTGLLADYHRDLFDQLTGMGVELEGLHTETGPGALEAAIAHQDTLEAADRAVLFKQGVKQISYRHGLVASFMAKPRQDMPGCGGHLHQSLWRDGKNVFHDATRPHGISELLEHYLAGQLALMPALMPLYAPNVNSYKRYVAGSWAATRANWGIDNRTTALRVVPGGPGSMRLETRVPGADGNPYLVMAAALASGLYGIEHKLQPPHPAVAGSAYGQRIGAELPKDLGAAAGAMERGTNGLDSAHLLAPAFRAHYLKTRHHEWAAYQKSVTDWERNRYFELA